MGIGQSKTQDVVVREKTELGTSSRVFLPSVPIEFSPSLLSVLDSSPESDYTRAQYTEQYIQKRVSKELEKTEKETAKRLEEALKEIKEKKLTIKKEDESISTDKIQQHLEELKKQINSHPEPYKADEKTLKIKENLTNCLKINTKKPMLCEEEMKLFKERVHQVENDILAWI